MAGETDNRKTGTRILLGAVVLLLGGSMLLYLVPQTPGMGETSTDAVASVGGESVTAADVRQQLNLMEARNPIPKAYERFAAQQIVSQLVFEKELEYEAKRLGITVSDQERADRIKQFLPTVFNGGTFVGMDQYAAEVNTRFQLTVPVFEELIRQGLLEEKFRKLVTDGISVGPQELQEEFRYKNEKVKLDYALLKPDDFDSKIVASDADLRAAYDKDKAKYQIPERRTVRYAIVDLNQLRQTSQISDDQLKAQYQQNIQQFQVPNRVHAEHILLTTVGKTTAEVAEIKKTAEDVLKQAKKGSNFEDLAKKYSEDPGSKAKGGDLGWIIQGQTVPEFEKTAFSLNKGQVSDLVTTQYGFHIIKILDKETAHTKPFEEVRDSLRAPLMLAQADQQASALADQMSATIRQSNKTSIDDLAKQYHLQVNQTRPLTPGEPVLELGNSQEVKDTIFKQRQGELSLPIKTDRGYVVTSVSQIQPAHQGTFEEVRDRVAADWKHYKAVELAHNKADELSKRAKGGEKFDVAAKSLGLDAKTSDAFARSGAIPGAASGKQVGPAFEMKVGDVSNPINLGLNWLVYRVAEKEAANPADFEKQKKDLADQALQSKRSVAYEAFKTSLDARLKKEGKLKMMPDKLKSFGAIG